jgi:hypothetical protein
MNEDLKILLSNIELLKKVKCELETMNSGGNGNIEEDREQAIKDVKELINTDQLAIITVIKILNFK